MITTHESQLETVPCTLCHVDDAEVVQQTDEIRVRHRLYQRWTIVRCRRCGLIYVNPRLRSQAALGQYDEPDYGFQRQTHETAEYHGLSHQERVLAELEQFPQSGRKLLDIGCGSGDFLVAARARGWQVQGIEISPQSATVARARRLEVGGVPLRDVTLPSASFDVVTLWDVVEHFPDPLTELCEVARVLRTGGMVAVETPCWNSVYRRILRHHWSAMMPRLHLYYFEVATLEGLLRAAGLTPVSSRTEIVDLFSGEGWSRGIHPGVIRNEVRRLGLRFLLAHRTSLADRAIDWYLARRLRVPHTAIRTGTRSTPTMAGPVRSSWGHRVGPLVRCINRPLNRFFLARDMGEQLRVYARKPG